MYCTVVCSEVVCGIVFWPSADIYLMKCEKFGGVVGIRPGQGEQKKGIKVCHVAKAWISPGGRCVIKDTRHVAPDSSRTTNTEKVC